MMLRLFTPIWLVLACGLHAAGLEFSETLKEIHAKADAKTVTADFKFTNTGDKPVTISKYDAACSCMSVQISGGKLHYAPGESGVVRANFDMGNFAGTVDKSVALWLKGDREDQPSGQLTVRVHIPVLIELEPKTLNWSVGDEAKPKVIQIRMNHSSPIKVKNVTSSSEVFSHSLKTVKEGKHYELTLTPSATEKPGLGVVRIETDCDVARHRLQQVFAVVRNQVPGQKPAAP